MARRLQWLILATVTLALAQRFGGGTVERNDTDDAFPPRQPAEFHFVRLEYTDLPQFHRRWSASSRDGMGTGWWLVDWPAADNHFTTGISRLTKIDTGDPRHLRLLDDHIFDYPFVYATQAGWWGLTDNECVRLREYLLRGGFLIVDDFWGAEQWEVFRQTMERVLPGQSITDLVEIDSVMNVVYNIGQKDRTFIPGLAPPSAIGGRPGANRPAGGNCPGLASDV